MVDHVLLAVVQVGQPRSFGGGVVLDLIAGSDAGAGARVETGVSGIHGLNHIGYPIRG
jgi:hypothetical protein